VGHVFKAACLGASSQTKDEELAEAEKLVKVKGGGGRGAGRAGQGNQGWRYQAVRRVRGDPPRAQAAENPPMGHHIPMPEDPPRRFSARGGAQTASVDINVDWRGRK